MLEPRVVILAAMRAEADLLEGDVEQADEQHVMGKRFVLGTLAGTPIALTWTGMGKVNAAMVATLAIVHFRPTVVICTGIAGATNHELVPGDVVIAEKVAQYDFGAVTTDGFEIWSTWNPLTFEPNPVNFAADAQLLQQAAALTPHVPLAQASDARAARPPRIRQGVIVTGDLYAPLMPNRQRLREQFGADACDMESAAIAQVCWVQQIPCLVIRGISDTEEEATPQIKAYLALAVQNTARVVGALAPHLDWYGTQDERRGAGGAGGTGEELGA
jgi:adenosylhomocysteine nucleosidase